MTSIQNFHNTRTRSKCIMKLKLMCDQFQDEMRDWIMPVGFDHADAEAKHLIGIADDDKVSISSAQKCSF